MLTTEQVVQQQGIEVVSASADARGKKLKIVYRIRNIHYFFECGREDKQDYKSLGIRNHQSTEPYTWIKISADQQINIKTALEMAVKQGLIKPSQIRRSVVGWWWTGVV